MEKKKINSKNLIGQIILLLAIMGAIEFVVSSGRINKLYLASPSQIFQELLDLLTKNILLKHILATISEFLAGYGLSIALGIILGLLFVAFPKVDKFFAPFVSGLMSIPKVAIIPLLTIWFGIGFSSKVVLVFLFSFFTIFFNTISGAKQTSNNYLKVSKVFRASKFQTILKVLLPSAIPSIFAGLRVMAATGITGVIFAEMQASKKGLGFMLSEAAAVYNTPRLFLIIIIVTILSVILVKIVDLFEEKVFLKWKNS
ncbi:ABC transporter permease [Clostridium intestinale]|uniref:NitT/TauT family transport system permease protein n=1 Tax=Clostridium intestinale DSM 6191 TaxID=1121320 RepID=A0A1M6EIZ3_9CLOT|nr:ABC transporter permease [Clostridium intestinale]SHI85457.1 NitT/TauT family transport system permease protein [Clostridium intestinale DSM 6191]